MACYGVLDSMMFIFRQIVARGLLDVLREFSDNENDFISVMETVARMSEDGGLNAFYLYLTCLVWLLVLNVYVIS